MTLIDSLWKRSLYFFPLPLFSWFWNKSEQRKEATREEDATHHPLICEKENGCVPALSLQFAPFIEEKYYFIHAISVHSSAGASLDSQCHLHTNILINGSDVSTACSWGVAVGRITWSAEGIYNKVALTVVLKTFTQLYISTSAAAIQTPHK